MRKHLTPILAARIVLFLALLPIALMYWRKEARYEMGRSDATNGKIQGKV